jgi:hypothetical protein
MRHGGALAFTCVVVLVYQEVMVSDELFKQAVEVIGLRSVEAVRHVFRDEGLDVGYGEAGTFDALDGILIIARKDRADGFEEALQLGRAVRLADRSSASCIATSRRRSIYVIPMPVESFEGRPSTLREAGEM